MLFPIVEVVTQPNNISILLLYVTKHYEQPQAFFPLDPTLWRTWWTHHSLSAGRERTLLKHVKLSTSSHIKQFENKNCITFKPIIETRISFHRCISLRRVLQKQIPYRHVSSIIFEKQLCTLNLIFCHTKQLFTTNQHEQHLCALNLLFYQKYGQCEEAGCLFLFN